MVVLVASALWWGAGAGGRATGWLGLPYASGYAVSPTLVHSAVMVLGFIPLYLLASCSPQAPSGWGGSTARVCRTAPLFLQSPWLVAVARRAHLHAALASPAWRWRAPGSHG